MKRYSVVLLCFDGEHFVEIAGPRPDAEAWHGWSASMRRIMKMRRPLVSKRRKPLQQSYKSTRNTNLRRLSD